MNESDITEQLNELDAMAWRILRNTTLRALVKDSGRTTIEVTAVEADKLLEPFTSALMHDCAVLREGMRQMFLLGVQRVHAQLHGQPGIDDEMLDEAIEFHSKPRDTDAEALKP